MGRAELPQRELCRGAMDMKRTLIDGRQRHTCINDLLDVGGVEVGNSHRLCVCVCVCVCVCIPLMLLDFDGINL